MAGTIDAFPVWSGTTAIGVAVEVYVGVPLRASNPVFKWTVDGEAPAERQQLARHLDSAPARVLTYVPASASMTDEDRIGWIDLPDRQHLDEAGELVRRWVDSLSVAQVLAIARDLAGQDVGRWRDKVARAERDLRHTREWAAMAEITTIAVGFDDPLQREVAVRLVDDWTGTVEEFVSAVLDITA